MGKKDSGGFRPGERVLVPHTDKYYEAKVLKCKKGEDKMWYCLLHYQGWNKKWDEWVEAPGICKYNKDLVEPKDKTARGAGGGQRRPRKEKGGVAFGVVGAVAPGAEMHEAGSEPLQLTLPAPLKRLLLDDYERVVRRAMLWPLPRSPNVAGILAAYADTGARTSEAAITPEEEVANGLRIYFDCALPQALLYREEREQMAEALSGGMAPSAVYGGEHLLRLFIKLPELLPGSNGDAYAHRLEAVLDFMVEQREALFPRLDAPRTGDA